MDERKQENPEQFNREPDIQKKYQQEQNSREHSKTRSRWVAEGMAAVLLASVLYMACYGLFRDNASGQYLSNPLETQDTADWLMEQTYVLYHDLRQKQSSEPLSYAELYIIPQGENNQWVLDEMLYNAVVREEDGEMLLEGRQEEIPENSQVIYGYIQYLKDEYFKALEERFHNINNTFDYFCEDLESGAVITNSNMAVQPTDWYFKLVFLFDANGNCMVEDVVLGDDATAMRKLANEAARTFKLESDPQYLYYDESAFPEGLDTYLALGRPTGCRVTYGITKTDWMKYEQGAQIGLHDHQYSLQSRSYMGYWQSGAQDVLLILWFVVGIVAFLGGKVSLRHGGEVQNLTSKWLRLPIELLWVMGLFWLSGGTKVCLPLVIATLSGRAEEVLEQGTFNFLEDWVREALVYGVNLAVLMLFFFMAWYIGMNLRELRRLGFRGYIRERSLIYRFFPFIKSKILKLYDTFSSFDVTKRANKLIIRLVLVNGIILFVISSLWFGGFGIAVVYSVLLYFVLRKYISDLQKRYGLLLHATNEIAEGHLNVQIKEDLGVFEPFKAQVYRIQQGFSKAVEAELKSQRMKAELITNVSHDLKTPLTAIITYINLLKEENLTEEQRKDYLDTLERKSMRLKLLIEDLFEVSKADSQSMTLNIMDVDIMNLVSQVAFEMEDKLAERNLDLRLVLPEMKVVLPLDSQRTYRIYENLFGNIAKYAMPGTRVYVNGFCVEDKVIIILKNIAEKEIAVNPEELTDRFVRGDASRNTEGSGLGLAIAKSFTQLQGGELTIEVDGDLFKVTTVWGKPANSQPPGGITQ